MPQVAKAASVVAPKPSSSSSPAGDGGSALAPERVAGEIFLTPRVVDQRAFEEFSATLRDLVMDAASQSRSLLGATGEVKTLGQHLREATQELQKRVESAVRVVPTLDQRVQKAEQILTQATGELAAKEKAVQELVSKEVNIDRAKVTALVEEHLAAIVAEKLQPILEARVADFLREATNRHEALKRDVDGTIEKLKIGQSSLDMAVEGAEVRIGAIVEHAERRVQASSRDVGVQAEARAAAYRERLDEALEELAGRTRSRIEELAAALPTAVEPFEARASALLERLDGKLDEALARAKEAHNVATQVDHERLIKAARVAQAVADGASENMDRAEQIVATLNQAGVLLSKAQSSCRQLDEIRQQADLAKQELSSAVLDAGERIDVLEKRSKELRSGQEFLREALADAIGKAQELDMLLEKKEEQFRSAAEQAAGPVLNQLQKQAGAISAGLSGLIEQATQVGNALDGLIREARK